MHWGHLKCVIKSSSTDGSDSPSLTDKGIRLVKSKAKHIIVHPTPQLLETSQQIDNIEFCSENGKIIATPKPEYDSVQEDIL